MSLRKLSCRSHDSPMKPRKALEGECCAPAMASTSARYLAAKCFWKTSSLPVPMGQGTPPDVPLQSSVIESP